MLKIFTRNITELIFTKPVLMNDRKHNIIAAVNTIKAQKMK